MLLMGCFFSENKLKILFRIGVGFLFVGGGVGMCARQRSNFLLLRQKKVTKEKASRSQGRCAVPCAARIGRGRAKLASLKQRPP
jgi:hypothetical protein